MEQVVGRVGAHEHYPGAGMGAALQFKYRPGSILRFVFLKWPNPKVSESTLSMNVSGLFSGVGVEPSFMDELPPKAVSSKFRVKNAKS